VRVSALARLAPTVPVAAACGGLAVSNWLCLAVPALVLVAVAAITAAVVDGWARAALVGVACAAAGLWWGGLRSEALERSVLADHVGTSAKTHVVVTGPPRRTTFNQRLPGEVRRLGGKAVRERTMLELPLGRSPPQGAVVELRVRVRAPRPAKDGFDERAWLGRRGVHAVLRGDDDWRVVGRRGGIAGLGDRLRGHLERAIAPGLRGERRAVIAGVVLGDDEGLSEPLQDDFRASGLYHLLAVSGQNVLFIAVGIGGLAWLLGVPRLALELVVVTAICGYVLAVGWEPSVVRAGVAGVLTSLAWLASRPRERWHALALGACVLLAWTPATLFEPGFQLSFAAVAAIFLLVPRVRSWLEGYPVPAAARDVLAVSVVCAVATAPIVWLQFGTVPLYAVPANVLGCPAAAPLLILGLAAAAIEPVAPSAALAIAWVNGWLAAYLAWCAEAIAGLPVAQVGSLRAAMLIVAVSLGGAALIRLRVRRRVAALAVAGVVGVVSLGFVVGRPTPLPAPVGLRLVVLDVGQGDAVLLQVPEGNVLVDQGPPEGKVAQQLRRLGIRRLAALVLTHPQRDHVGGAADVLRHMRVDTVVDPALPSNSDDERLALAEARERRVPIVVARAGAAYRIGALTLRVLWPAERGPPGADPNDYAIVLLASYGDTDVLLPADAESNVTARLRLPPVEVLKVAHHGSADDGLDEQLRALRPRVAVISVGEGNDYGHPRSSTLAALRGVAGLRLFRTDVDGRVTVESDGRTIAVSTER
jgi:competence protein ComEC